MPFQGRRLNLPEMNKVVGRSHEEGITTRVILLERLPVINKSKCIYLWSIFFLFLSRFIFVTLVLYIGSCCLVSPQKFEMIQREMTCPIILCRIGTPPYFDGSIRSTSSNQMDVIVLIPVQYIGGPFPRCPSHSQTFVLAGMFCQGAQELILFYVPNSYSRILTSSGKEFATR